MARRIAAWPAGKWAKWAVLVIWIALLAVLAPLGGKLADVQENDSSAWLPKSAESTHFFEQSKPFFPDETVPAIVIYERPSGVTAADETKAKADATAFAGIKNVEGQVFGPLKSEDGKALQSIVTVKMGSGGWNDLGDVSKGLKKAIGAEEQGDLTIKVTGPVGYAADSIEIFGQGNHTLELITVGIIILILLFTYRSPILWILPLLAAGFSLMASQGVIYLLAKNAGLTVNAQSGFILVVLVLGASTDYALLLIARYREELHRHEDRHEAMAEALHRSGPAIIASAATVAVSLLVLVLADLNSTKGLGPVCAIGVGVGLLAMITLLPALLVIFGRWIFWPVKPRFDSKPPSEAGLWAKVGRAVSVKPRLVWVGTAVILAALSTGMFGLKSDGLQQKDSFRVTLDSVEGEELSVKHFPAGNGSPVQVIAKADKASAVSAALAGTPGIVSVGQPVVKGDKVLLEGVLKDAPDSQAAYDTVRDARAKVHKADPESLVGGQSAVTLDILDASDRDTRVIIPVVLIVVFLILALLLRAILAPLLLIGTVILSFGATMGVSSLMFNHVFKFENADPSLPLWVFVFLVALGIDYNIFLVTRVREEALQHGTRKGALTGLSATGGVITSAGLVLAGTFLGMASMPMVFITEMGFAVAFGVLLDTIIVRSVLVTALTLDVGRIFWWPSKLMHKKDDDFTAPDDLSDEPDELVKSS